MYIPNAFLSALYFLSSPNSPQNQAPAQLGCPSMTIRCVKDGKWPGGILGDIGKKEFCWEFPRCNQCNIGDNTEECNLTFLECDNLCQAFAPIPF